jgi:hypothetical protein
MTFGQDPLLTEEAEEKLKSELGKLWDEGLKGPEIAEKLGFGKPGPYEKLKLDHIYFYRIHFGLEPRQVKTMKKNLILESLPPRLRRLMVKWRPSMPQSLVETCLREGFLYGYPSNLAKSIQHEEDR